MLWVLFYTAAMLCRDCLQALLSTSQTLLTNHQELQLSSRADLCSRADQTLPLQVRPTRRAPASQRDQASSVQLQPGLPAPAALLISTSASSVSFSGSLAEQSINDLFQQANSLAATPNISQLTDSITQPVTRSAADGSAQRTVPQQRSSHNAVQTFVTPHRADMERQAEPQPQIPVQNSSGAASVHFYQHLPQPAAARLQDSSAQVNSNPLWSCTCSHRSTCHESGNLL